MMNDTPAARCVALERQVAGLGAELAHLRLELATARIELQGGRDVQLREANEQLVLSALRAQQATDTITDSLDELTRTSQRDTLTDTPNRVLMHDRIEQAIVLARRHGMHAAVLFVDLDDFKLINDTLGHGAGDTVLQLTARRLESVVRESDTVSRHGGDEFIVLLAEVLQASNAQAIAEKLLATLAEPCVVQNQTLRVKASIGIALFPDDGDDAATLVERADAAMYRAKRRGGGGLERHDQFAARDRVAESDDTDAETQVA